MHYLAYTYTPPYALHRPLLPICAPRAGIPSKTDHRVRKLTYTLQPGGGRPYNRQRKEKGGEKTHILMICGPGEYCGWWSKQVRARRACRHDTLVSPPTIPPACRTISSWDEKFYFPPDNDLDQDLI